MLRRRRAFLDVKMRGEIKIAAGQVPETAGEPFRESTATRRKSPRGCRSKAGLPRKIAAQLEAAAAALEARAGHREFLAHLHGRRLVAQSCDKDFHKLFPTQPILAAAPASSNRFKIFLSES
jgi:hypothetical protein